MTKPILSMKDAPDAPDVPEQPPPSSPPVVDDAQKVIITGVQMDFGDMCVLIWQWFWASVIVGIGLGAIWIVIYFLGLALFGWSNRM